MPTPHIRSEIIIKPLLLNPSDEFTILALASSFKDTLEAHARIAGVKRIERKSRADLEGGITALQVWVLGSLTILVAAVTGFGLARQRAGGAWLGVWLAIVIIMSLGFPLYLFRRARR